MTLRLSTLNVFPLSVLIFGIVTALLPFANDCLNHVLNINKTERTSDNAVQLANSARTERSFRTSGVTVPLETA